jgi:hypothetical protein
MYVWPSKPPSSISIRILEDCLAVLKHTHKPFFFNCLAAQPNCRAGTCLWDRFLLCVFSRVSVSCGIHDAAARTYPELCPHFTKQATGLVYSSV